MQELIIYLLKSAGLMSLFFAGYFFLLKNDTSFKTNRLFLLAGIITSTLLPLLKITRTVMVESTATPVFFQNFSAVPVSSVVVESAEINWWQIAGIVYLIGLGFFLLKFFIELFSLLKLIFTHKTSKEGGFYIIQKAGNVQPFSFFKFIVLDPEQHTPTEQELIIKHECSHARQWHSVDQILSSLSVYLLWFNPLAWLYRKSVVQNLEYLADKEVMAAKVSKKEYQKTLLKISVSNFQPALTNQFYQSFIKKRIIMLNKNATQKSSIWKTGLLLPFLVLFIFSYNIRTEAMEIPIQEETGISKVEVSAYVTKDSDEETLRAYERIFKKQGVDLKFNNLQFSEGLLTRVTSSFRKKSTGTSGNLTLSNAKGITPLLVYTDGEQVTLTPKDTVPPKPEGSRTIIKKKTENGVVFKLEDSQFETDPNGIDVSSRKPEGTLIGLKNSPLYMIEGKEYKTSQLAGKYVEVKGEWSVLKPKEAEEQFGSKAKDGAIIISESNIIEDFKAALKDLDLKQMASTQTFIEVRKNDTPLLLSIKTEINQKTTPSSSGKFELQDIEFHADPKINLNGKKPNPDRKENTGGGVIYKAKDIKFQADPDDIIAIQRDEANISDFTFQEEKPLVVVEGEVMKEDFNLNSIDPKTIKSLSVLKGESAVEKYGSRAKNGVIEIKRLAEGEVLEDKKVGQKQASEKKEVLFTAGSIKFEESKDSAKKKPYTMSSVDFEEKGTAIKISEVSKVEFPHSDVLYVVDGKEMKKDFDPSKLDPDHIEFMIILKGSKATEKYGDKAANWGVIEITTKK